MSAEVEARFSPSSQATPPDSSPLLSRRELIKTIPFVWTEVLLGEVALGVMFGKQEQSLQKEIKKEEKRQAASPSTETEVTIVDLKNDYAAKSRDIALVAIATGLTLSLSPFVWRKKRVGEQSASLPKEDTV